MLTHIVCHIFRMARPTNFRLGIQIEDDDPHQRQMPWPPRLKVKDGYKVTWPAWAMLAHKSNTDSHSITKIARRVPHDTCYIAHQFQGQKVRVTGWPTKCAISFKVQTVRPKNFKVGVQMVDVDPYQRQVPWSRRLKIKVISSHCLYVLSLPLLNLGKKILYLCH